ncbi:DUF6485 family protein [Fusobacterium sp. PH5-44]|uniref:DUF6485 family protein n=1 Tax=unclassified Fusobacterium TaxID=2648384 RepID=UPI003D1EF132
MEAREFCTCTDHKCPFNPVNNNKGCDLCILKCLKLNEIPSCFFKKISLEKPEKDDYTFKGFAKFVEKFYTNKY